MLRLMFITASPEIATMAMNSGINRIFVDLEVLGKCVRQKGLNTVQSQHCFDDIANVKAVMKEGADLLVRSNPIHENSRDEIRQITERGADIVMLPYFKTVREVEQFVSYVDGKAKVCLLIETKDAFENIDNILQVEGVDEYYVGLNDLHLDYKMRFMFEPLANGMMDEICAKIRKTRKPFGFGGIANLGRGLLPAEKIIIEHYRLGSSRVIISRSFCDTSKITDFQETERFFDAELLKVRDFEKSLQSRMSDDEFLNSNHLDVKQIVDKILESCQ